MLRLTEVTHANLATAIKPGDYVIDATAGNGHDTQFLAECVGPEGCVLAIDRQVSAIANTTKRLKDADILDRAKLIQGNHADLLTMIPDNWIGSVKAVVFNLGYLPGSDKSIITSAESTEAALDASLRLLATQGLLSILVYRGHEGGYEEEALILDWLDQHKGHFSNIHWNDGEFPSERSPRLLNAIRS